MNGIRVTIPLLTQKSKSMEGKPFQVVYTSGRFVRGYDTLEQAEKQAAIWNSRALSNGRKERYLAIPKPDTIQAVVWNGIPAQPKPDKMQSDTPQEEL